MYTEYGSTSYTNKYLYVNDYSISLANEGRKAVRLLFQKVGVNSDNIFL